MESGSVTDVKKCKFYHTSNTVMSVRMLTIVRRKDKITPDKKTKIQNDKKNK